MSRWPLNLFVLKPTAPAWMASLTQSATACFSSSVRPLECAPPRTSPWLQRSWPSTKVRTQPWLTIEARSTA